MKQRHLGISCFMKWCELVSDSWEILSQCAKILSHSGHSPHLPSRVTLERGPADRLQEEGLLACGVQGTSRPPRVKRTTPWQLLNYINYINHNHHIHIHSSYSSLNSIQLRQMKAIQKPCTNRTWRRGSGVPQTWIDLDGKNCGEATAWIGWSVWRLQAQLCDVWTSQWITYEIIWTCEHRYKVQLFEHHMNSSNSKRVGDISHIARRIDVEFCDVSRWHPDDTTWTVTRSFRNGWIRIFAFRVSA